MIDLEEDIINELDFNLLFPFPTLFLERYQRIFCLDKYRTSKDANLVNILARDYCKVFLKSQNYLKFKPSQIAAAAFMIAVNAFQSPIAQELSLKKLKHLMRHAHFKAYTSKEDLKSYGPLAEWNSEVEKLTSVKRDSGLKQTYSQFLDYLNQNQYKNQLSRDPNLFFPLSA